jgi:hypothetical protein
VADFIRAAYTPAQLAAFVAAAQKVIDDHFAANFPGLVAGWLEVQPGKKWDKIVLHGRAWAFIEKATGLICKPESWKRPAKGARGTIHTPSYGAEFVSWTGPRYLRDMPAEHR